MTDGNPPGYCKTKAKLSLNVQQWMTMAVEDAAKASFSSKRAERASRQYLIHLQECQVCEQQSATMGLII